MFSIDLETLQELHCHSVKQIADSEIMLTA